MAGAGAGTGEEGPGPAQEAGLSPAVLEYYKRFGRHRDLEQYFSLSTLQGDVRDPSSMFWRSIKTLPDTSDSGDKLSEPQSTEVCRISINCTVEDPSSSSQDSSARGDVAAEQQDVESPPIINEDILPPLTSPIDVDCEHKSDLDTSRKSIDFNLDTSLTKPQSPTSSVTSQRKLEWDSLADVGYNNDRKSASSLSTLERLALHQQLSISEEIKVSGRPTAHSTPLEEEDKPKSTKITTKGLLKKTTKLTQKDVDIMQINVDKDDATPNINLNLTKHISFNVDSNTGTSSVSTGFKIDEVKGPGKVPSTRLKTSFDKEIQTSLPRCVSQGKEPSQSKTPGKEQNIRVFVNLDAIRSPRYKGLKYYRKKIKNRRKKIRAKQKKIRKENKCDEQNKSIHVSEVIIGGSQVSEADSFEYMPAHVYHQNTARNAENREQNIGISYKTSSLESSGGYTTHSSKNSQHSFTKDLELSIALLNKLVQQKHKDANLKRELIKEVVSKLIRTNYRDDESPTDFLSGLSFDSRNLDLGFKNRLSNNNTTTSTSDTNHSGNAPSRPKKSILRSSKSTKSEELTPHNILNLADQASTSSPRKLVQHSSNQIQTGRISNSQDENTSRDKTTSEDDFPKTSSEQIYQCYLRALKKEEEYKKHLQNKQEFMKHKLVQQEMPQLKVKSSSLKDLMDELTRNSFSKAAGDGILKLPESFYPNVESDNNSIPRKQRSHSVFTLSAANSERKKNPGKQRNSANTNSARSAVAETECTSTQFTQSEGENMNAHSKVSTYRKYKNLHYCCCPYHSAKIGMSDSAVQVDKPQVQTKECAGTNTDPAIVGDSSNIHACLNNFLKLQRCESVKEVSSEECVTDYSGNKFVCFCNADGKVLTDIPDNFLIYKCCKLPYALIQPDSGINVKNMSVQCSIEDGNSEKMVLSKDTHVGHKKILKETQNTKKNSSIQSSSSLYEENQIASNVQTFVKDTQVITNAETKHNMTTNTNENTNNIRRKHDHDQIRIIQKEISTQAHLTSSDSDVSRHNINEPRSSIVSKKDRRSSETITLSRDPILRESRHMQTSVSIDPKISKPLLSDINIVNENIPSTSDIQLNSRQESIESLDNCVNNNHGNIYSQFGTFNKEQVIQLYQPIRKPVAEIYPKRQSETEALLEAILQSGNMIDNSTKNTLSPRTYNANLINPPTKKESDTDLELRQVTGLMPAKRLNTEVNFRETGTSPTDINYIPSIYNENNLRRNYSIDRVSTDDSREKRELFNVEKNQPSTSGFDILNHKTKPKTDCNIRNDHSRKSIRRVSLVKDSGINSYFKGIENHVELDCEKGKIYAPNASESDRNENENLNERMTSSRKTFTDEPIYVNVEKGSAENVIAFIPFINEEQLHSNKDTNVSETAINLGSGSSIRNVEKMCNPESHKSENKSTDFDCSSKGTTSKNRRSIDKEIFHNNKNYSENNFQLKSTENSSSGMKNEVLLESIKEIIKRYAKEDKPTTIDKRKSRHKYYKEIINKLHYLLHTEETGEDISSSIKSFDAEEDTLAKNGNINKKSNKPHNSSVSIETSQKSHNVFKVPDPPKKNVTDKATQLRNGSSHCKLPRERLSTGLKHHHGPLISEDSSDIPISSDMPGTSSDSFTYEIIKRIRRECERFNQKHCQCCTKPNVPTRHREASSSTSVNFQEKMHCSCRTAHRCRNKSAKNHHEKHKKKSIAYNLIIQPSDSIVHSDNLPEKDKTALKDIVIKVPSNRKKSDHQSKNDHQEEYETQQYIYPEKQKSEIRKKNEEEKPVKVARSRSLPEEDSEISSFSGVKKIKFLTVREYLERNRPDFVNNTNTRQDCLRVIHESRMQEQRAQRQLLSLQVEQQPDLTSVSLTDLRDLAKILGRQMRTRRPDAKFLNEREMKQHSRNIYKTLPEVLRKKEQLKKDHIRKTNMVMTSLFNKNLQKKVLRGSVDISNYSPIIKI